jgi:hypothetical protein
MTPHFRDRATHTASFSTVRIWSKNVVAPAVATQQNYSISHTVTWQAMAG